MGKWYEKSYRRNLVDMHIENWDERFLSKLNPENYVNLLKEAQVQTAMIYANSHVGYCYWPTQNGEIHNGIKGTDFVGRMIELLHNENISVVVYFSLICDNWAYKNNTEWRIVNEFGLNSMINGDRHGRCCPNNKEYRKYIVDQVTELCQKYDHEGMFFDLTYWPCICHCNSCKEKYYNETGEEIPNIIDWFDKGWTRFQKKREDWMTEFVDLITSTVKDIRPQVTVEHQFATAARFWRAGTTEGIIKASEYAGGDLYGGILQQTFICKLYHSVTMNEPFEYMTSRCYSSLRYHTATKTRDQLEQQVYIALAHNGAFLFIDAIDPTGTMQSAIYEKMGSIFENSMMYEQYLGGNMCRDAAVYYSMESKMSLKTNKTELVKSSLDARQPHFDAAFTANETLKRNHIPYTVISKSNLDDLSGVKVLILPDVYFIEDKEINRIIDFVCNGGSVYISGNCTHSRLLNEKLGLEYIGETEQSFTYMAPKEEWKHLMPGADEGSPLSIDSKQTLVKVADNDNIIADIVLPYTDQSNPSNFASIASKPPDVVTQYPAVIYKNHGLGKIIWTAAPLEATAADVNRIVFTEMIKELAGRKFSFSADAPPAVEILMYHQPANKRYVLYLLNEQELLPPVSADDIQVMVCLNGKDIKNVQLMPQGSQIPAEVIDGYVVINIPKLYLFHMILINYI